MAMLARPTGSTSRSSGPPLNEVARIEALCEPLGRAVLISAEFAAAIDDADNRLKSLGHYDLRGVRETKQIFALAPGPAS